MKYRPSSYMRSVGNRAIILPLYLFTCEVTYNLSSFINLSINFKYKYI